MCLYIVPGPVGSVSSIMGTTWAVISWSVPSYIPSDYPIITYEVGYHILQSGNCLMANDDDINIQMLQFSNSTNGNTFINITGLNDMSCYIFGVRAYTDNGYGEWTVIANETLELPPQPSPSIMSTSSVQSASSTLASRTASSSSTGYCSLSKHRKNRKILSSITIMKLFFCTLCMFIFTECIQLVLQSVLILQSQ